MAKKKITEPKRKNGSNGDTVSAEEVAKAAGVSVMTVSRAFRDAAGVSQKNKERIIQIAKKLGYQPSQTARSLRTGKVEAIGFIISSHNALRGGYHSESLAAIDCVVSEKGYNVLLSVPPRGFSLAQHASRLVHERRVGGLVVQGSNLSERDLSEIETIAAPKIVINYTNSIPHHVKNLKCIGFDNWDGIEQAVRHLVALGHERIAYIGGTPEDRDAIEREDGFRRAIQKLDLELREDWLRPGHFANAAEAGQSQGDYLMAERINGPTAVICASDSIAFGVLTSARRAGRRIPEQLSVVGFDDEDASLHVVPPLTTLRHSGWDLGIRAGEELMSQVEGTESEYKQIKMQTHLVVRESTGPPAKP